jgi:phage terminase large subunit-like protein
MNYVLEYYNKIESGEIIACNKIKMQFKKLADDINNPRDPWVFDEELGLAPIEFIEQFCRHSKGKWAGKKIKLELFQKAELQAKYGFIHKDTGFRKYRECLKIVARKNGKSTEKSAESLFMLIGDGEPGSEVYCVATKKDQAKIVFNEVKNMMIQSPVLDKHLRKRKSDIFFDDMFATIKPLASDSNSMDGLNTHYCVMDELHAWKNRNLYDVMKQSTPARDQPLIDMITTAGFVREGIYDNMYNYAANVLEGNFEDEHFLAFIYELDDPEKEWTDPDMWIKANPGLGTIKPFEYMKSNVERAKNDPMYKSTLMTKDLNVRNTIAGSWLSFTQLNNEETFDLSEFKGHYAVAGTDLSSTTDLTCSTILLRRKDDENLYVHQMYWIPEDILQKKVDEDKVPYDVWVEQGWIRTCPGNRIQQSYVTDWHRELLREHKIYVYWHGYDDWNASYWVEEMKKEGFNMEVVRQGAKTFSGPMKNLAADLQADRIIYNNNPVLKWCLSNTSVSVDKNENIRPDKSHNRKMRIDGTVSLIDAYVEYERNKQDYMNLLKK